MKTARILLLTLAGLATIYGLTLAIAFAQNGPIYKNGESLPAATDITGKTAEQLTLEDLRALSKAQLMVLFQTLPAPAAGELRGEYTAGHLDSGVMSASAQFFTDHFFGDGAWNGKALNGQATADASGEGYNLFGTGDATQRQRRFRTSFAASDLDGRPSLHLIYAPFNGHPMISTMRDEVRRVNADLYLGMGAMALNGGAANPAPFFLTAPARPWRGVD